MLKEFVDASLNQHDKKFWGKAGAGCMFVCSEDSTILLLLRSPTVDQGGTWGIPGGGIGEAWFVPPITDPLDDDDVEFIVTALDEVQEECGSLPPDFGLRQAVASTMYRNSGFKYKTHVFDLTLAQKKKWKLISLDGETSAFRWFPQNAVVPGVKLMGHKLHFGVEYTLNNI